MLLGSVSRRKVRHAQSVRTTMCGGMISLSGISAIVAAFMLFSLLFCLAPLASFAQVIDSTILDQYKPHGFVNDYAHLIERSPERRILRATRSACGKQNKFREDGYELVTTWFVRNFLPIADHGFADVGGWQPNSAGGLERFTGNAAAGEDVPGAVGIYG